MNDQPLSENIDLSLLGDDNEGLRVGVAMAERATQQTSGGIEIHFF